jgi:molybdopterin converting factor subunit 1
MKIRILLFARAKDLLQADHLDLELPAAATVGDLRRTLAETERRVAGLLPRSAIAVNDEFADDATVLDANAKVALLPPVSGG